MRALGCSLLLLAGCQGGDPGRGVWLQGAGFGWETFNHRLSFVSMGVDDDGAWASAVGGTSTTMQGTALPEGCVADECREFPYYDRADIDVHWVEIEARGAVVATGQAAVLAAAAGTSTELVLDLPSRARGEPVAVLGGFQIDTDSALSGGDSCYDPQFGWLPRRIAILLGEPVLSDDHLQVTVPISAAFEAGPTLEDERACLDAVVDQAQVGVVAHVVVIVSARDHERVEVSHDLAYPFGEGGRFDPDEQPPPDLAGRPLAHGVSGDVAAGWSGFDFRFHQHDVDGRGAYVRTLALDLDPGGAYASGHATNYSPGTQFSGFDYDFTGTVEVLEVRGVVRDGRVADRIEVQLDDDGDPVVWELGR